MEEVGHVDLPKATRQIISAGTGTATPWGQCGGNREKGVWPRAQGWKWRGQGPCVQVKEEAEGTQAQLHGLGKQETGAQSWVGE